MERLTIPDEKTEGGWKRTVIDPKEVKKYAMTIYWDLKKYEDTGLTPDQIRQMDILYAEKCREVAELRKAQGWIPVEERLPEDDSTKRYIVTDTDGHVWSSIWYGYAEEENKTPCFYCWDDDMWQCYKPDVIAWRPLPEPYQPEQTAKRPEWQERMLHTFLGGRT